MEEIKPEEYAKLWLFFWDNPCGIIYYLGQSAGLNITESDNAFLHTSIRISAREKANGLLMKSMPVLCFLLFSSGVCVCVCCVSECFYLFIYLFIYLFLFYFIYLFIYLFIIIMFVFGGRGQLMCCSALNYPFLCPRLGERMYIVPTGH